jgi:hypothetical protein
MLFPVPEAVSLLKRALQAAQGSDGEDRVIETLKGLDDRYTLVTNWVPEEGKGDVDLLLLGPHGVLVIEVKTYVVDVKCEGDKWSIRNERGGWRPVKSFSRQLAGNMKRTSKALGVKATGVLVFNDRASLEIANCPALILRRKELLNRVHSLPETESEIDRLRTLIPELLAAA